MREVGTSIMHHLYRNAAIRIERTSQGEPVIVLDGSLWLFFPDDDKLDELLAKCRAFQQDESLEAVS